MTTYEVLIEQSHHKARRKTGIERLDREANDTLEHLSDWVLGFSHNEE
jgi:hypothetical protein